MDPDRHRPIRDDRTLALQYYIQSGSYDIFNSTLRNFLDSGFSLQMEILAIIQYVPPKSSLLSKSVSGSSILYGLLGTVLCFPAICDERFHDAGFYACG